MKKYLINLCILYAAILIATCIAVPAFSQQQFSFSQFHCYTDSDGGYCFDVDSSGHVGTKDLLIVMPWYGWNHFDAAELLLFNTQYGVTTDCDLYNPVLDTFHTMWPVSSGALFYYPALDGFHPTFGVLQYTMDDEGEEANPYLCNLTCLKSFIYVIQWSDDTQTEYAFHNLNP
jgi:hypothetical protein